MSNHGLSFFFFSVLRAYIMSHSISPFLVLSFFEIGSRELFVQVGFKPWSSWVCLLSCSDYSHEPPVASYHGHFGGCKTHIQNPTLGNTLSNSYSLLKLLLNIQRKQQQISTTWYFITWRYLSLSFFLPPSLFLSLCPSVSLSLSCLFFLFCSPSCLLQLSIPILTWKMMSYFTHK
jgi:hypothetical protein